MGKCIGYTVPLRGNPAILGVFALRPVALRHTFSGILPLALNYKCL